MNYLIWDAEVKFHVNLELGFLRMRRTDLQNIVSLFPCATDRRIRNGHCGLLTKSLARDAFSPC